MDALWLSALQLKKRRAPDLVLDELAASGLDTDYAFERTVNEAAAQAFRSDPPDFNECTTKVRIALETVARRAAPAIAGRLGYSSSCRYVGCCLGVPASECAGHDGTRGAGVEQCDVRAS